MSLDRPFSSLPEFTQQPPAERDDSHTFAGSSYLKIGVYDPQDQTLVITFQDGTAFAYRNVPEGVWAGLKAAGSAGKYFHAQVRGRYAGSEV